jgi:hypothetical protein
LLVLALADLHEGWLMRTLLRVIFVFAMCGAARFGRADTTVTTSAVAKPSIVLIEYDPWAMVIGSDTPTFALYEDGTVIYRSADRQQHVVKLPPTERAALGRDLGVSELAGLNDGYRASYASDQPTNRVCVWTPTRKCVAVYGSLRSRSRAFPGEPKNVVPATFQRAFERMIAFSHPAAKRWLPPQLEIMIQPFSADTKVEWPQTWGTAQLTKHGGTEEVFLDGRFEDELRALFQKNRGQRWVLVIDGRTWAVSGVRTPFPGEAGWMQ